MYDDEVFNEKVFKSENEMSFDEHTIKEYKIVHTAFSTFIYTQKIE